MLNGNKKTALKKNKLVVKATIVMQYPLYIQHARVKAKDSKLGPVSSSRIFLTAAGVKSSFCCLN